MKNQNKKIDIVVFIIMMKLLAISYLWLSFYWGVNALAAEATLETPPVTIERIKEVRTEPEVSIGTRTVTMYTSRPEETDNTPCIGAKGEDQCVLWKKGQNLCATNEFPLDTVLKIEGLGECLVYDRMNRRYETNVDWYNGYDNDCLDGYHKYDVCPQLKEAKEFGAQERDVFIK